MKKNFLKKRDGTFWSRDISKQKHFKTRKLSELKALSPKIVSNFFTNLQDKKFELFEHFFKTLIFRFAKNRIELYEIVLFCRFRNVSITTIPVPKRLGSKMSRKINNFQ